MTNIIIDLLRADGSIVINKKLAKAIGIDAAIIYSELVSRQAFFESRGQLTEDGYFFNTIEDLEDGTMLSKYQQSKAIKKLEQLELIKTDRRDIPPKRYFKIINNNKIVQVLQQSQKAKNLTFKSQKTKQSKVNKVDTNNTNKNNTNNNKLDYFILSDEEHIYARIYLDVYDMYMDKSHPTISMPNLILLRKWFAELEEQDIDEEKFYEQVLEHFNTLPESNNGSIISFMKASKRYFDIDAWSGI